MSKKRAFIFLIIGVVLLSLVGLFFLGQRATAERGNVAVIRLSGEISEGDVGPLLKVFPTTGITPKDVKWYLERARRDGEVKAVVLRINSPGGAVAASQEIARMIKEFQEESGKPVVVSMGDIAASGGYYISTSAKKIVAQPGTITGSIGVIITYFDVQGLLEEKLGIKAGVIKSGKYKDMLAGFRPLTDEERRILQRICDEAYDQFIRAVAEGRNLPEEKVRELATGEVFLGSQALKLGLVDMLGGLDEAVKLAGELAGIEKPIPKEYIRRISLWEIISPFLSLRSFPSSPELAFLKHLEGYQLVPRYHLG